MRLSSCRPLLYLLPATAFWLISQFAEATQPAGADGPSYVRDVLPIFRANCFSCHQDSKKLGSYLMTAFDAMLVGGESQSKAIVPGDSNASHLVELILSKEGKAEMPKNGKPLSDSEVSIIRRWIDAGAKNDALHSGPKHTMERPPTYSLPPTIIAMDFSPDGKWIAVNGFHETLLFNTSDWKLHRRLIGFSPRIESVRFSPDGKWLAVAAGEQGVSGELQIWNLSTLQLERSKSIGSDTLFGVNWSPDSSLISFAMADNTIRVVNLAGEQVLYQRSHEDWPRATVFSVDGKHLMSVSRDRTVKLYEVATERFIDNITSITPGALRGGVQALARHPERDEILVGGADGVPKIYRVFRQTARVIGDDANLIRQLDPMPGRIFEVAVSRDGKYLAAAATLDGKSVIRVWSYDVDGKLPAEIKAIQAKRVAGLTAEEKKKLETYVTEQPATVATWEVADASIYSLAFDSFGRIAASGSDGRLRVWNCADASKVIEVDATPNKATKSTDGNDVAQLRMARLSQISQLHTNELKTVDSAKEIHEFPLSRITSIEVRPNAITLTRWNDSVQLIVSAKLDGGEVRDATRIAQLSSNAGNIWLSTRGWVQPLLNGHCEIEIKLGGHRITVPVDVKMAENVPIDFVRDVNPVLSRLGCNQGTCHGAQAGKNGFKLSLRGYDPIYDVRALADDLAGRRINPSSPIDSLMMTKPLGVVPHMGGKLLEPGDSQSLVIRQWIAEGAKIQDATPRVARIELEPVNPVVPLPGAQQQLRVIATYQDGSVRDVTREAFLETGNGDVASILDGGRVLSLRRGEAPILARYEGSYSATTLTVMGDRSGYEWKSVASSSPIDQLVASKWERMKIKPSDVCNDTDFLRRVTLDLTGLPPTSEQVKAFLSDPTPTDEKRNKLIDTLLSSDAFTDHWTNKWSDLLQVNSKFLGKQGAAKFRDWIRESIATNKPYHQFVREIVTARGSNKENAPASYYKILRTPEDTLENTTHLFLAVRFNCNKCHDHPFERWTQDQYYQTAAYFSQFALKKDEASGKDTIGGTAVEGAKPLYEEVIDGDSGEIKHQRTGQTVVPKFPFDCEYDPPSDSSRRAQFAAWLTSPKNPYFARSYVNRMWGYLLGKGLIEPIDDIRAGNPASIPELLAFLEKDFIEHQFDVRHLIRTICRSKTYQLSMESNDWNKDDDRNYSHAMPRRLPAEVLFDAIHQVTGSKSKLPGMTPGARAAALADADAGLPDGFLNNLGRPPRESACECERSSELRLGSIMALVSGPTIGSAISDKDNSIRSLVEKISDDRELINELFLRVLNRPAQASEVDASLKMSKMIDEDHSKLAQSLSEREDWWKEEKPKRVKQQQDEKADAERQLAQRIESIREEREQAEKARLERLAKAEQAVKEYEEKLPEKLDEYLSKAKNGPAWQTLMAQKTDSSNKATLIPQADRSIQVKGSGDKTTYTISTVPVLQEFNAVRLEALASSDLKGNGPGLSANGNFVVTELEVFVGPADKPKELRQVKLVKGFTDFDQQGFSAAAVIDDKPRDQGGWAINGAEGTDHWAVFSTSETVKLQPGEIVQWRIHQYHNAENHRLGRFRLSVGTYGGELSLGLSETLTAISQVPKNARTPEISKTSFDYLKIASTEGKKLNSVLNKEKQPLPEDEVVVTLKKRIERLSIPVADDGRLVRMRSDVKESENQLKQRRLTMAEDVTWALINSPAFLFNH